MHSYVRATSTDTVIPLLSVCLFTYLDMPAPQGFPLVKRQLLVSDFDESFADADTDRWTFEVLAPHLRRKFEDIGASGSMQFTDMCAMLLRELHAEGVKADQIVAAQKRLYVHPAMVRGVKALRSAANPQTDCFLLSNSNTVYLQSVLEVSVMKGAARDAECVRRSKCLL